jgi:hypothetical protein
MYKVSWMSTGKSGTCSAMRFAPDQFSSVSARDGLQTPWTRLEVLTTLVTGRFGGRCLPKRGEKGGEVAL